MIKFCFGSTNLNISSSKRCDFFLVNSITHTVFFQRFMWKRGKWFFGEVLLIYLKWKRIFANYHFFIRNLFEKDRDWMLCMQKLQKVVFFPKKLNKIASCQCFFCEVLKFFIRIDAKRPFLWWTFNCINFLEKKRERTKSSAIIEPGAKSD